MIYNVLDYGSLGLNVLGSILEYTGVFSEFGMALNVASAGLAFGATAYGASHGQISKTEADVQYAMDATMALGTVGGIAGKMRMASRGEEAMGKLKNNLEKPK